MNFRVAKQLAAAALISAAIPSGHAVDIVVDYRYDTTGLFPAGGAARTTLEKAAADLSAVLANGQLSALTGNAFTGNSEGTLATATWSPRLTNPVTGVSQIFTDPQTNPGFAADEIRIFAGWRPMGPANLGQSAVSKTAAVTVNVYGDDLEFDNALAAMKVVSNASMLRGEGPMPIPRMGEISGTLDNTYPYILDYGIFMGSVWFNGDTDSNGVLDSQALLETGWNLGLDAPQAWEFDFYTVAMQQIIQAIGFGDSLSWNRVSGDDEVSGKYLASGVTGTRLSDGVSQDALMAGAPAAGVRRELTSKDLQYLKEIGYTVITPVPEPGSALMAALAGAGLLARRRRK